MLYTGGAFFTPGTKQSVRKHYNYAWPAIVHALALWLSLVDFQEKLREGDADNESKDKEREKRLHLVLGEFALKVEIVVKKKYSILSNH